MGVACFVSVGAPEASQAVALEASIYRSLLESSSVRIERFPLPGAGFVDLQLAAFSVTSPGARWVVVGETGVREEPLPDFRAFRGRVVGDPDSRVVLSLVDGRLVGTVETYEGRYTVARAGSGSVVRSFADDPDRLAGPLCEHAVPVADAEASSPSDGPGPGAAVTPSTPLVARIAIDAPYEWYSHHGSETAARDYILNLMAQVSAVYEDEVRVRLEVPYLRIFTTPDDPYSDTQDTQVLLGELRAEWNANQTAVERTAVHLFGRRTSGGSGIAYLDVLCHHESSPGASYDYGVSTMSASGASWERQLVAHELGHNFSSPHTHCYVPEIDQCANESGCYAGEVIQTQGTIMSYCNSTSTVFHQRVQDERIRPAAEAAVQSCMATESPGDSPDAPTGIAVH